MKKAVGLVLALALTMALASCLIGCSSGYTTIKGSGYSFEVNSKWEAEKYDSETYYYYPNGEDRISYLYVSEYSKSYPDNSLSDQYDAILKYYLADGSYADGALVTKYTNIEKGTLGAYAFVTADGEMITGSYTIYSFELYFYTSPTMMVTFRFSSTEKSDLDTYKKDIDRLFKSIKLI